MRLIFEKKLDDTPLLKMGLAQDFPLPGEVFPIGNGICPGFYPSTLAKSSFFEDIDTLRPKSEKL
jgi:hypothetical protein